MAQSFEAKGDGSNLIYKFLDAEISSITIDQGEITITVKTGSTKLLPFTESIGGFEKKTGDVIDRFEKKVEVSGAIKTIIALSQNIENGAEISTAPLESQTATRIIADILDKKGKKPSEVGLAELSIDTLDKRQMEERGMTEQRGLLQNYTINYPHSVITGVSGMPSFNSTKDEGARLFVANQFNVEKVQNVLLEKGLNAVVDRYTPMKQGFKSLERDTTRPEEFTVRVSGKGLDEVLGALQGRDDIIPSFIANEIIAKTKELRPQTVAGASIESLPKVKTQLFYNSI